MGAWDFTLRRNLGTYVFIAEAEVCQAGGLGLGDRGVPYPRRESAFTGRAADP
jgi:hypothetical protein